MIGYQIWGFHTKGINHEIHVIDTFGFRVGFGFIGYTKGGESTDGLLNTAQIVYIQIRTIDFDGYTCKNNTSLPQFALHLLHNTQTVLCH